MKKYSLYYILILIITLPLYSADKILDHIVILNKHEKLDSWTSYDNIINWSINFITNCPTVSTIFGEDPWYLVTAKFNEDGTFMAKQNNQGSNVYWAVETHRKYYAYTGNRGSLAPVKKIIDRVIYYHTPFDWAWPNVPRTQDDTPDGEYTDERAGVDKISMCALGYLTFYKITGDTYYRSKGFDVCRTLLKHITNGNKNNSPLPFRVNLKTGEVLASYTSNMITVVNLLDVLIELNDGTFQKNILLQKRNEVMEWIIRYPLTNYYWSGYFEDVKSDSKNFNQQNPMETARYILLHKELDPNYRNNIPKLLHWVKNRYGKTQHYGATSIREQDSFLLQMSSHTARYASVVTLWSEITQNEEDREEARAAFALSSYSAYNKNSKTNRAINYVGIEYKKPWFSDSYWDYLSHFFDGMSVIPEMLPQNENHLFSTTSVISNIRYFEDHIQYQTFNAHGQEKLKLLFNPLVYADGKPLAKSQWEYKKYRGVSGVLIINRKNTKNILIKNF